MKNFISKIFIFFCACLFLSEGLLLGLVRFGHVSLSDATVFYNTLLQTQSRLDLLFGVAAGFLCLGLICLYCALRNNRQPDVLVTKSKGNIVRIPVKTVREYIKQVISRESRLEDVEVAISKKGKWVYVDILCACPGDTPVHEETRRIKETLKKEIKRVFEFTFLKINFQLETVQIVQTQNRSGVKSANTDPIGDQKEPIGQELDLDMEGDSGMDDERVIEEIAKEKKTHKFMPWERR